MIGMITNMLFFNRYNLNSVDLTQINHQPQQQRQVKTLNDNGNETSSSSSYLTSDKRMEVKRPSMESTSHSFLDSIRDIERSYPYKESDQQCNVFGGSKFIDNLIQSSKSLLQEDNVNATSSNITSFKTAAMEIFMAENVSVIVSNTKSKNFLGREKPEKIQLTLEASGKMDHDALSRLQGFTEGSTMLSAMTKNIKLREDNDGSIPECTSYIDYPVLLVDNNIDTWNWWWFLMSVLKHYITMTVTQPFAYGDYNTDLRIMHTMNDESFSRSFIDAFEFLFSDRRGRDSRQIWSETPQDTMNVKEEGNMVEKRFCFRKLIWSPDALKGGGSILVNQAHGNSNCYSSILYSYAANLKAALHIPTLPRPIKPRVVWVGRDTSLGANGTPWQRQRIFNNQDNVIEYLKVECWKMGIEFIVADFYGEKKDMPFQEQALLVSRANIMIGVHGAGLNMFHFLPFNSVILEIHINTNVQMNSANFVNHIIEGKYLSINGQFDGNRNMVVETVWGGLKTAISEWEKLGHSGVTDK